MFALPLSAPFSLDVFLYVCGALTYINPTGMKGKKEIMKAQHRCNNNAPYR